MPWAGPVPSSYSSQSMQPDTTSPNPGTSSRRSNSVPTATSRTLLPSMRLGCGIVVRRVQKQMVNKQRTPLMVAVTYVVEAQRRNNGDGVDMESHSFCGVVEINGDGVVSLWLHPGYGIRGLSPTGRLQGPRQNRIPQDTQQEIQPRPNLSLLHYATSCHLHSHLLLHRHVLHPNYMAPPPSLQP
ncbi:hypothetical protein ACFX2I_014766 [Malus domestica]